MRQYNTVSTLGMDVKPPNLGPSPAARTTSILIYHAHTGSGFNGERVIFCQARQEWGVVPTQGEEWCPHPPWGGLNRLMGAG